MRSAVHFLPILTTLFAAFFAPQLFKRWGARRPAPHLFWWGLGVALYGAGTVTESLTTLFGWHAGIFRAWYVVMPWVIFIALLLISSVATYSWSSLRIRRSSRLFAIAGIGLLGAALVTAPWVTLLGFSILYLAMLPFSIASYDRVKRRRAGAAGPAKPAAGGSAG